MDNRKELSINSSIILDGREFFIEDEIGRGGSFIVYNAYYLDNLGQKKYKLIREFFPFKYQITRNEDNYLIVNEEDKNSYEKEIEKVKKDYIIVSNLCEVNGLSNSIQHNDNIDCNLNNTIYIISNKYDGDILKFDNNLSLKKIISLILTISMKLKNIYDQGYYYLDLKPQNVLVLSGSNENICLFDFGSIIKIDDISKYDQISFSKGFSAPELQIGDIKKIKHQTDIFSIGALLYYLLFGKNPSLTQLNANATFDFNLSFIDFNQYSDKVKNYILSIFHKTLPYYYKDRFDTYDSLIEQLEKLITLSDINTPFVYSSIIDFNKKIIGRDLELNELNNWFEDKEKSTIFVTGVGGIGKSSLAKEFIRIYRTKIDNYVYLDYDRDIVQTINNDYSFKINTIEKDSNETKEEYYIRKLDSIKRLKDQKTLIVIDNYTGKIDKYYNILKNSGLKVIFITRKKIDETVMNVIKVSSIRNNSFLLDIFEYNLGRKINDVEVKLVNEIISKVSGHTLVLTMIAKQIKSSNISLKQAFEIINDKGVIQINDNEIEVIKDVEMYGTIENILNELFNRSDLSINKQTVMQNICLFGKYGISIDLFNDLTNNNNFNDVNELCNMGWLNLENDVISFHPIIYETISKWKWTKGTETECISFITKLYIIVKLLTDYSEYPKELHDNLLKSINDIKIPEWYKKKMNNKIKQKGLTGALFNERLKNIENNKLDLYNKNEIELVAKSTICLAKKLDFIQQDEIYPNLLFAVSMFLPSYEEEIILNNLFIILKSPLAKNKECSIKVYNKIITIYEQRFDYKTALDYLDRARKLIFLSNPLVKAEYYGIKAAYYDCLLSGQYYSTNEEDNHNLHKLLESINKSIKYLRKTNKPGSKKKEAEYILSKANILIRSFDENSSGEEKIMNLLLNAKDLIDQDAQNDSFLFRDYNLVNAWYFAIVIKNSDMVYYFIQEAEKYYNDKEFDYDAINEFIIPTANMYYEIGDVIRASNQLKIGINVCQNKCNIKAYERLNIELLNYFEEVNKTDC